MKKLLGGGRAQTIGRELLVTDQLPYTRHISESVVGLESGQMMTVLEIEGASFETADSSHLNTLHSRLNLLWRNVNDERIALWTHVIRVRDTAYPDGEFKSTFSRDLNEKYRKKITSEKLYRNRLFLTILWAPARGKKGKGGPAAAIKKALKQGTELDERGLMALEDVTRNVIASLGDYEPKLLTVYERDELMFSEVMEFLNGIGSVNFDPMPMVDGPISGALLLDRPLFGREVIELRGAGESRFAGMLGIKEYPATTRPGMLNGLLQSPFELVVSQSFAMVAKADTRSLLTRKQNQMVNTSDRAVSQIDDLDLALDDLESNRFTMGEHHLSLMVLASSTGNLMAQMANARRMLSDSGIVTAREDLALESAYWGQWPGNFEHRPRSGHISSKNFASLSPFHSYPKGKKTSHWGPALALLKTASGCAFHFNLHYGDLGSTFICGPSGSGKTVTLMFILSQLEKHGARRVIFDKDRGAEIYVRAAGGNYLTLRNGEPTGCAPLKALDLSDPGSRTFAAQLIAKLASREGAHLSVSDQQGIEFALLQMLRLDRKDRTLSALIAFINQKDPEGIASRLNRWAAGSPLGWVFDNEDDSLGFDADFLGFDMTDFLDNPEIRTPLMMYLFYRVERLIDGRPIVIAIDEFWKALGDEAFQELAKDKLKTIRKQNGLMIFATQSPKDAMLSPIGHTIIGQCPTKIFMPSTTESMRDYEGFELSQRELELVRSELTNESRQFLVKQGHNSVVVELALDGFDDELTVLSGRTAAVERLDQIRAMSGDDPDIWLPRLLSGDVLLKGAA